MNHDIQGKNPVTKAQSAEIRTLQPGGWGKKKHFTGFELFFLPSVMRRLHQCIEMHFHQFVSFEKKNQLTDAKDNPSTLWPEGAVSLVVQNQVTAIIYKQSIAAVDR